MNKVTLVAIISITFLESIALLSGLDGALFSIAIAAVAGLGGYEVRQRRDK